MVLLKHASPPMLIVVSVVDVPTHYILFVCRGVIKDVAADATMNKTADHISVTNDIVMVVEDIVYEDRNKTLKSDVIADMAEDVVYKPVGQSGVENDGDHAAGEEIVATADENVVKQVSYTTTHK